MSSCIFTTTPHACYNCSVSDKLQCLLNHRELKVSSVGKKILRQALSDEIKYHMRVK